MAERRFGIKLSYNSIFHNTFKFFIPRYFKALKLCLRHSFLSAYYYGKGKPITNLFDHHEFYQKEI
ncbi:MAG: hypothetical protein AABY22_15740 [Nanoarchaeota archaeon]